jgi:DNA-binding MarR family transcriptional regulator
MSSSRPEETTDIRATFKQWDQERPDLELSTLYFSITVLRLAKIIEDDFEKRCRAGHDLGANDVRVLLALRRSGQQYMLRPTDIFQSLLITAGAVTKQVDRLSARSLVRRRPDPAHAGGTLVQLTAKGRAMADDIVNMVASEGRIFEAFTDLPQAQRDKSLSLLLRLLDSLSQPIKTP